MHIMALIHCAFFGMVVAFAGAAAATIFVHFVLLIHLVNHMYCDLD